MPENLNNNVEYITLENNEIKTITKTSLANYPNLIRPNLRNNAIRNIRDGSFDHNAKLQILQLKGNSLRYIPANFFPAQISLVTINLNLVMEKRLPNLNLRNFPSLCVLWLGANPLKSFDASYLPKDLGLIGLKKAMLTAIPDLSPHAPNITSIEITKNNISYISPEFVSGLKQLNKFDIGSNQLETIPDFYDTPLQILKINDNPISCNVSLCWVRLWAQKKTEALTGISEAVCHSPSYFEGYRLMDVDAVKMGCYKGRWYIEYIP